MGHAQTLFSFCSQPCFLSARLLSAQITLLRGTRHPSRLLSLNGSGLGKTSGLGGLRSLGGGGRTRGGGRTWTRGGCLALGLVGTKDTLETSSLDGGAAGLLLLKLSQTACLGVDVLELLLTLVVCVIAKLLEQAHLGKLDSGTREQNIQKSTSFFPVGVLVAFSKYEFKPENSEVAFSVMP